MYWRCGTCLFWSLLCVVIGWKLPCFLIPWTNSQINISTYLIVSATETYNPTTKGRQLCCVVCDLGQMTLTLIREIMVLRQTIEITILTCDVDFRADLPHHLMHVIKSKLSRRTDIIFRYDDCTCHSYILQVNGRKSCFAVQLTITIFGTLIF